jgi:hypothetical protein
MFTFLLYLLLTIIHIASTVIYLDLFFVYKKNQHLFTPLMALIS